MIYSKEQRELLEYIASTNNLCAPSTNIRKIMEIVHLDVIEFNKDKNQVSFYTSETNNAMLAQNFIQCLVVLDKLEKDNLIFIEKGYIKGKQNSDIKRNSNVILSKNMKPEQLQIVNQILPSKLGKYWNKESNYSIDYCGYRQTNSYELIKKYADAIIYPTPELIEFVENGFKTPEQVRFEKQLEIERSNHNITINWTRYTLITAIIVPLLVCIIEKFSEPMLGFLSYIFLRMLFV